MNSNTHQIVSLQPRRLNDAIFIKYRFEKRLIWCYVILLILEGALRKWVLPSLATPLLIVRDPICIVLIYQAIKKGIFPSNGLLYSCLGIGLLGFFFALFLGHGSFFVALYGARLFFLHLPVMFLIGRLLDREDLIKIGKFILLSSIPMSCLLAIQFYSPQSAWVNRGLGGEGSAGFNGALGYFRPSGTFSFTLGVTMFYGICACFVFYFWLNSKLFPKILLWSSTAALVVAIPLSISRGLFFQILVIGLFATIASLFLKLNLPKIFSSLTAFLLIFIVLLQTDFFQKGRDAFLARLETANLHEGGIEGTLGDRFLGGLVSAVSNANDIPTFGYGIGMGTNAGSMLLSGEVKYLIAEGEWARMIGELGPILGLAFILLRVIISLHMAIESYRCVKRKDTLPFLLLGFALVLIPQGNTAQPTSLGFLVVIGGLLFASLKIDLNVLAVRTPLRKIIRRP